MNSFEWPLDPTLLFDAARDVNCYYLTAQEKQRCFLVFSRRSVVIDEDLNSVGGVMLALFESDEDGQVFDWNERYDIEGHNFPAAWRRFVYRFVNGQISPIDPRANQIGDEEREQLDALLGDDYDPGPAPPYYFDEPKH